MQASSRDRTTTPLTWTPTNWALTLSMMKVLTTTGSKTTQVRADDRDDREVLE